MLKDAIKEAVRNGELTEFVDKVLLNRFRIRMAISEVLSKASPLYDFVNHIVEVKVSITLPVSLGDGEHSIIEYVQFFIVEILWRTCHLRTPDHENNEYGGGYILYEEKIFDKDKD
ncbi:hypothetical protein PVK06_007477 [Gossypium arboreum]|uniref:Uncharacterized protein n=1 Tax=Gossypium arboreum TaxID=29729 RepID=A0ABR0QHE4_GOSAR|nr:hypothetical protein PVK06_007477 [Gossypium arboreum]